MRIWWPETTREAREVQQALATRVRLTPLHGRIRLVAGVDAAFAGGKTVAAVSVYDYGSVTAVGGSYCVMETSFPYVPGYLSFREGPAVLCAIRKLDPMPDVFIFDGQGIAHPRRLGIASHIGVLLGKPSIGCAKSRLVGHWSEPSPERGASSPLYHRGELRGMVVRTRTRVKPVFVSPGHLITIEEAVDIVLHCTTRYRLPEPVRAADRSSKELKRKILGSGLRPR